MWIHVPTPGDHYSPAYGSARITVAYEISRHHEINGGKSRIIVGRGTLHDHPIGECVEVEFGAPVSRNQKIIDVALGRLGLPRHFGEKLYSPVLNAIPIDFDGPVFLHNNPVAVSMLAKARPKAQICLWAANELFNTYTRSETRKVVRNAGRVICVSDYIADDIREHLGYDDKKIKVVGNGVNIESFHSEPDKRQKPPIILFVGRVVHHKGVDLLVKAAQILANKNLDFRVKIVGSTQFDANDALSPFEKELRELAAPIKDKIEFQPAVARSSVVEEYQKADIFCSPIRWKEPFGLTYLEAMASGLPVVTAPLGGAVTTCGNAAHYFEPENVDSLAQKLESLLSDPELHRVTVENSRKHAESCAWNHRYDQLVAALS